MKKSRIPLFSLAIDWETTGYSVPNYAEKHQGISFGAIIFNTKTLEPIDSIYHEIKFNHQYQWSAEAERIHGLTQAHLLKHGVTQEEAANSLGNLIIKYIGIDDIILLGHRVHFDRCFTEQLMSSIGITLPFHPTVIDSCSMATILMEMSYSDEIFSTLGMPVRGKHNSLEDITYTLEAVRRMKEYFIAGVASTLN